MTSSEEAILRAELNKYKNRCIILEKKLHLFVRHITPDLKLHEITDGVLYELGHVLGKALKDDN